MSNALWVVVDVEATCWSSDDARRAHQLDLSELIELGALIVPPYGGFGPTSAPLDQFESLIKPARCPTLSAFCMALTEISQEVIDDAPSFPEVWTMWRHWIESHGGAIGEPPVDPSSEFRGEVTLISWGRFDDLILARQCSEFQIPSPRWHHLDAQRVFQRWWKTQRIKKGLKRGTLKGVGLKHALELIGAESDLPSHRALSDAQRAWAVLRACYDPHSLTKGAQFILFHPQFTDSETFLTFGVFSDHFSSKHGMHLTIQELESQGLIKRHPHGQGISLTARGSWARFHLQ
jgi:inhibitor of KinA sporulation pathway (predicted exonuclease)